MSKQLNALIIMDGFGITAEEKGNAVIAADVVNFKKYWNDYPSSTIHASGMDVGLPNGQMGNSEVGHLNIGAGRIVYQEFTRITKSIEEGDFFSNDQLLRAVNNAKEKGTNLHVMGLVSDGGVHSHITHLYALLKLAKQEGLPQVYIHCFMDGRDTPPRSGINYIKDLEEKIKELEYGCIATVTGRYYAMDRDKRWDRVNKAYDALVMGKGEHFTSAHDAMKSSYDSDITDEFVLPSIITKNGEPKATIAENDSIVFFNFRPDRARQITKSFIEEDFNEFERGKGYFPVCFVSLTQYDETFKNIGIAFKPQVLKNTFGEYISKKGYKQLRIAETEKYAHVTFFFNGGVEEPNDNEDRDLIPSPKVATYDLKPSMSAVEVTDQVVKKIESDAYDVIILNYANCDMVGHTGSFDAAVEAVKTVDECLGRTVEAILKKNGNVIITADHGNAEKMMEDNGEPFTAHSTNDVPFVLVGEEYKDVGLKENGRLADITPTLLEMMDLEKPDEMTGNSLIIK